MSCYLPFSTCNNLQFDFIAALDTSQIVARDLIHDEILPKKNSGFNFLHPQENNFQTKILGGSYLLSKCIVNIYIYIYMSTFHLKI